METGDESKTYMFRLGENEFAIEVFGKKKVSLFRFFDIVAKLAEVELNQIVFTYKGKEIFFLDGGNVFDEHIVIHTPKTPTNPSSSSNKMINKYIYKLSLHFDLKIIETWSVSPNPSTISDILKPLTFDDDFSKIFTSKFQIFIENQKMFKKSEIKVIPNFSEIHIKQVPVSEQNQVKLYFRYSSHPLLECIYDRSCKWKTITKNTLLYFGLTNAKFYCCGKLIISQIHDKQVGNLNFNGEIVDVDDIDQSNLKHFYNKIEFNNKAPDHRIVADGLNFKCICKTLGCSMKNEIFMECMGYGVFLLSDLKNSIVCRSCQKLAEIKSFGIYSASLKVYLKGDRENKLEQFENYKDFYVSFDYFLRKFKDVTEIKFECKS